MTIRKMVERKAFLANLKHHYHVPNMNNMIVVPITKRMEIILSIQVYHISQMDFDYKENGGKKSFFGKSKASISCISMRRT